MMEGWKELKIKDFCEFKYGKNLPENKRIPGQYPVYGSSNLSGTNKEFLVEGPGIIIGRKGTVGRAQFSKYNFFPIDTTFYVAEDKSQVDLKFLYYRLPLCGFEEMNSDAAVPGLNRSAAISQKINLPPLPTQRKIASILSAYDDLIENNLKRIKLLEEKAQLTYEEWFVRLKFPGHENTPINKETGLPQGWKKKKIEDICTVSGGGTPSKAISEYWDDGTITWFSPTDLSKSASLIQLDSESQITELGLQKSSAKLLQPNSFMITSRATIGLFGIIDKPFSTNQGFINVTPNENFEKEYLIYNFKYNLQLFINYATGATFLEISKSVFKQIKINWPTIPTIKSFNEIVSPIHKEMLSLTKQNQLLREARDILLPRLMTGMIDVEQMNLENLQSTTA